MKTAIIFCDGVKQIILTPENDDEKFALSLLTPSDDMSILITSGTFGDKDDRPFTKNVSNCVGGYLRLYNDSYSRIIVLTPKEKEVTD